jgi:hypothetical protein
VRAGRARVASAAAAGLAATALLAACGGTPERTVSIREYTANSADLIDQLHGDLVATAQVGDLGDARRALARTSDLMPLLMAYDDFAGCQEMVRNNGSAGPRFGPMVATLQSACRFLERGSQLFETAATRSDAVALLAASRTTLQATPLLFRAKAELVAASAGKR